MDLSAVLFGMSVPCLPYQRGKHSFPGVWTRKEPLEVGTLWLAREVREKEEPRCQSHRIFPLWSHAKDGLREVKIKRIWKGHKVNPLEKADRMIFCWKLQFLWKQVALWNSFPVVKFSLGRKTKVKFWNLKPLFQYFRNCFRWHFVSMV